MESINLGFLNFQMRLVARSCYYQHAAHARLAVEVESAGAGIPRTVEPGRPGGAGTLFRSSRYGHSVQAEPSGLSAVPHFT